MKTSEAPPARFRATDRIFATLNRFSLRSVLLASILLVVLFCALVAAFLRASQGVTYRAMDSLIEVDNAISGLCLRSNAAMAETRRLEKDFLLNYPEFGFDEARSRYVTRLVSNVADIKANMAHIRALARDPAMERQTLEVENTLDCYRLGVEDLVDRLGERGSLDSGVYGEIQAEARALERLVRRHGSQALLARLLEARVAEKTYVERTRDTDVAAHAQALAAFDAAAAAADLPAGARRELAQASARYRDLVARYVQATEEIRSVRSAYLRAVQSVEPLLENLYLASVDRVAAKRRAVERSTRMLSLPVIVAGGLVLVLTGLLSLGIAVTVTRSVIASKSFAERIAAGDLGGRLVPGGGSEFVSLATALNRMAESLHQAEVARRGSLEALRESEEKYRTFVETSSDWIWELDAAGRHTFSNGRVREILGIEPEELSRTGLPALVHPDDLARATELLGAGLASGNGWHGAVLRWRHRDGTWRWIESSAVAVRDARGAVVGFRGVDRDVTERRRLEEELVRTQKLEAIGTLAGGIAHDFNNLLQGVFGFISLARMRLERDHPATELLAQAEKAIDLSVNLTTQLLTFAKGGKPVKGRIALAALVEDPVRFALSGSKSAYRIAVDPALWAVDADGGQLAQVIQNLVINASEAMPAGGTVDVAARNELIAAGANPLVPAGGRFVRIDVTDTGTGISAQDLARIFDPYYTTKQKGSGLGLATSYSIVRNHDGFIDLSSRVGEGTVFSVHLPAASGDAGPQDEAVAAGAAATGRVLVMDDDPLVRDVAAAMIASLGHEVAAAANGEEAVELFARARAAGRPFDVVVLDLTVKHGMGGEEALGRLLALDPLTKAVVSTGYADAPVAADYRAHGFAARLNKPYQLADLRECLASLLPARGPGAGGAA
jgi:PAS domain S-box-containing protein